jgi:hypothetical protein
VLSNAPSTSMNAGNATSLYFIAFSILRTRWCNADTVDFPASQANYFECSACLIRCLVLISFSIVFRIKEVRLIGLHDLGCSGSFFPAVGI